MDVSSFPPPAAVIPAPGSTDTDAISRWDPSGQVASIPSDAITRELLVAGPGAILWAVVALVVGAFVLRVFGPRATTVVDATIETPAPAFAVGFVALFTPLTAGAILLFAGSVVPEPFGQVAALGGVPPFLIAFLFLVVTGPLGVVVVGRWIGRQYRDPGPLPALLIGTAVLAPTQLVPVFGYVVTVGVATLGGGAMTLALYAGRDRSIGRLDELVGASARWADAGGGREDQRAR